MRGPVFTRPLGSYGQCADHRFAEDVEKAVEKERAALRKNGTDADPLLANLAVLHEQTAAGGGAERPAGVAEAPAEDDDRSVLRRTPEAVRGVQRGARHDDGGGREEQLVGEEPAEAPEPDPQAAGAVRGDDSARAGAAGVEGGRAEKDYVPDVFGVVKERGCVSRASVNTSDG